MLEGCEGIIWYLKVSFNWFTPYATMKIGEILVYSRGLKHAARVEVLDFQIIDNMYR